MRDMKQEEGHPGSHQLCENESSREAVTGVILDPEIDLIPNGTNMVVIFIESTF